MSGTARQHRVRWPWLTPMRAARGPLRQTGVAGSFLIHLAGLVGLAIALGLFDQWFWHDELYEEIGSFISYAIMIDWVIVMAWVTGFELSFVLFAFLTTCWGAGVEPYKQSFGRSLSRWYQLTPWLAMLLAGFILALQGITAIDNWYWDQYSYGRWGNYYYNDAYDGKPMRLLDSERFRLLIELCFYGVLGITNLLALWWVLGTLMVHRDRPGWHASCRWPAVCEGCGYALAGLTDEQGCPECGKPVGQSKHTERGKREVESLRMMLRGLFMPSTVGAAMVTRRPTKMPLRVLLWGLFFAVLCGPVVMVTGDTAERLSGGYAEVNGFGEALEFYIAIGLTVGIYAALIGSLLLLGAGTVVATIVRLMGKRDIMPAACFAACYSAALLPVWVLFQATQLAVLIPLARYLDDRGRYDLVDFFPFLMLALHGGMLVVVVMHVARITKAARFANV